MNLYVEGPKDKDGNPVTNQNEIEDFLSTVTVKEGTGLPVKAQMKDPQFYTNRIPNTHFFFAR